MNIVLIKELRLNFIKFIRDLIKSETVTEKDIEQCSASDINQEGDFLSSEEIKYYLN